MKNKNKIGMFDCLKRWNILGHPDSGGNRKRFARLSSMTNMFGWLECGTPPDLNDVKIDEPAKWDMSLFDNLSSKPMPDLSDFRISDRHSKNLSKKEEYEELLSSSIATGELFTCTTCERSNKERDFIRHNDNCTITKELIESTYLFCVYCDAKSDFRRRVAHKLDCVVTLSQEALKKS